MTLWAPLRIRLALVPRGEGARARTDVLRAVDRVDLLKRISLASQEVG